MLKEPLLSRTQTALVIVDVQERFSSAIYKFDELVQRVIILVRGCRLLGLPVLITEQYSKGLGKTIAEIAGEAESPTIIEKVCFSAADSDGFLNKLSSLGKSQILLAGIEAHVCINQTTQGLLTANYDVHLPVDAIGSRDPLNKKIALKKMTAAGAQLSTVEMALFELLRTAEAPEFKAIQKLVM